MTKKIFAAAALVALGVFGAGAQQGAPPGGAAGQGRGGRQGGGGAGSAAQQVPSISRRPTGSELETIRVAAQDENIWFGWRVAVPTNAIKGQTFSDVLPKLDVMSVANVEIPSSQQAAFEVPKPLDYRLQPGERNAVNYRLRELREQVAAYRVENWPADEATERKVLEFGKGLVGAPVIIVPASAASNLAALDKLATEYDVTIAVDSKTDPKALAASLADRSKHVGIAADVGGWIQNGVTPVEGLKSAGARLVAVTLSDKTGTGAKAQPVLLGGGNGAIGALMLQAYRSGLKPLVVTVENAGTTEADLLKQINAFERVMLPAMAERMRAQVASPAGQIRGGDRLSAEMRAQIDAAAPRTAPAAPKKPRKLLVTDIQAYSGHATIPHGNYLLQQMAKYTSAYTPTFSNDPELLKYPKIKEFDGIWLNNACGMVFNDPEVRAGLLRYVQEGGGLGGHHAVSFVNNNWPEWTELMGGWAGAHHVEKQMIKVDDPDSPLTKSFGPASFEHTDEYYIFPMYAPYSRQKQHVLLSIDVDKSDRATTGRFCDLCTRPDQDYGLAWIKEYGKGRTYFTILGHTEALYSDQRYTNHLLAAIQYVLGDLSADATPSAKMAKK